MARITIKNDSVVVEVPSGGAFVDYARETTSFPFGCGNGECGICLCVVLKGVENLNDKNHREWELIQKMQQANPANRRLGCQIRIKKEGDVELEY